MKYNDSLAQMLAELRTLADNLDKIEVSVENKVTALSNLYPYNLTETTTIAKQKIYSESNSLTLKLALDDLARNIEAVVPKKGAYYPVYDSHVKLENDAKLILLHTYRAVKYPTADNCNTLHKKANEVSGQQNVWAKVGIVLTAIVGLTFFVYPGLIFLAYLAWSDLWERNSLRGMAKFAYDMHNAIINTGVPKNIAALNIVKPEAQSENPVEARQLLAVAVPLPDTQPVPEPQRYNPGLFSPQSAITTAPIIAASAPANDADNTYPQATFYPGAYPRY